MSNPKPPAWLKPMNKAMVTLQKIGVVAGPVRVLTVTGRKTGLPRSTPATPFVLDDCVYVVGGYPGADWVRNARAAGSGTVTRGRKKQQVVFTELTAAQAVPVLAAFPHKIPRGVGFFKRSGLVRQGTAEEFAALAGQCAVFRLDPTAQN